METITARRLLGINDCKDLFLESSVLIKTNKIEINYESAYAIFTLNEVISSNLNQKHEFSTYTCIFKKENGTCKYSYLEKSQGKKEMKPGKSESLNL